MTPFHELRTIVKRIDKPFASIARHLEKVEDSMLLREPRANFLVEIVTVEPAGPRSHPTSAT